MKNMQGFSFFGLLFLLAILSAVISVAIKIIPSYLDFLTVCDATKQTLAQPRMAMMTQDKIMEKIANQLSINNIRLSELEDDAIVLRREDGELIATIEYSVIKPVFTSEEFVIDLDMHFNRIVEASAAE